MFKTERETLRVDVPVGFLLPEPREITVAVDRPTEGPLAIRLRLIPAQIGGDPAIVEMIPTAATATRPPKARQARDVDDGFPGHEYGGGD